MLIRVGEVQLYFDVGGPELVADGERLVRRPVVIALHGGPGFDHGYLKPALAPITKWAQVIFLDLRGQGRSQKVRAATVTLETMADDIAVFCTAVGIERPIILGHSAGGYVALTLALRHPRLVGALLLANSAARFDLASSLALLKRRHGAAARDAAAAVFAGDLSPSTFQRYLEGVLPSYTHPSTASALSDFGLSAFAPEVAASFFSRYLPNYDIRAQLPEVTARTLVVTGDSDWLTPPDLARETADALPNAEFVVLPETGHLVCNERPEVFAAMAYRTVASS